MEVDDNMHSGCGGVTEGVSEVLGDDKEEDDDVKYQMV